MKGEKKIEPVIDIRENVISSMGGLIAISLISMLAVALGYPMVPYYQDLNQKKS